MLLLELENLDYLLLNLIVKQVNFERKFDCFVNFKFLIFDFFFGNFQFEKGKQDKTIKSLIDTPFHVGKQFFVSRLVNMIFVFSFCLVFVELCFFFNRMEKKF